MEFFNSGTTLLELSSYGASEWRHYSATYFPETFKKIVVQVGLRRIVTVVFFVRRV